MAGFDLGYQKSGTIPGGMRIEAGDPSYYEVSSTYVSVPTQLTKVIFGWLVTDGSNGSTAQGRASPRIGEPSNGVLDFSLFDVTSTDTVSYFAVGW